MRKGRTGRKLGDAGAETTHAWLERNARAIASKYPVTRAGALELLTIVGNPDWVCKALDLGVGYEFTHSILRKLAYLHSEEVMKALKEAQR